MTHNDGGPAFPRPDAVWTTIDGRQTGTQGHPGMSLHDAYTMAALSNPALCTGGGASDDDLRRWFGENCRMASHRKIAIAQARSFADEALRARKETS